MIRQLRLFSDDGKLIKQVENHGSKLKGGWIVVYKNAFNELINMAPNLATVRVYGYLMVNQTYDTYIHESIASVASELSINYKTAWKAVNWLENEGFLKRVKIKGQSAFLLSPSVTTCGSTSLFEKQVEWSKHVKEIEAEVDDIFACN